MGEQAGRDRALAQEEHLAGEQGEPLTREPVFQAWCAHWTTAEAGHILQDPVTGKYYQHSYVLCISRNNAKQRCTAFLMT